MEPDVFDLPSHSSPFGIRFYRGSNFPNSYHLNSIFIAEHG
jgi:glucose/arabinose dehydrogenase